jgi:hypothetical protein
MYGRSHRDHGWLLITAAYDYVWLFVITDHDRV